MSERVDVLVEDRSMEAVLRTLLPQMLGATPHEVYSFQGKRDLLAKLPARLRGYARIPAVRVVVILDRDQEDCGALKGKIDGMAAAAGLTSRTSAQGRRFVSRIAIEELEAWYFGDWSAVCSAYSGVRTNVVHKAAYRHPDAIRVGTAQALERVLNDAGHYRTGLPKLEAARKIAAHMDPSRNSSPSFRALRDVLAEMRS